MQLESPPLIEHLFLESPWAVMAVCGIAAGVLMMMGIQRRKHGLMIGSPVCLVLAVGVYLLANSVTTDRENLITCTCDLVMATAPLDAAGLDRLLAPEVVVTGPDGSVWLEKGKVLPRLNSALQRFTLNSQKIRQTQAVVHPSGWADSTVRVRSDFKGSASGPVNTDWRLSWRRDPATEGAPGGGWRVVEIRWLRFNGLETPQGMMP